MLDVYVYWLSVRGVTHPECCETNRCTRGLAQECLNAEVLSVDPPSGFCIHMHLNQRIA